MSFIYGEGRFKPKIKILKLESDSIEFSLKNADLAFANSLRRVIISEVPTMAIDMVQVTENTSPLFDEFVVHRLGLVPLISEDIDNYNFPLNCICKEGCDKCKVDFDIIVKCDENIRQDTIDVTSEDIKPKNKDIKVRPVKYDEHGPIVITKLKKGQSINMTLTAKKGIGKTHAKWSPVCTCVMKQVPDVEFLNMEGEDFLNNLSPEDKIKFCEACPSKVFKYDENKDKIIIEKPGKCTYCEECMIKIQDLINKRDKDNFLKLQQKLEGSNEKIKQNKGPSINYREIIKVEPKPNEFLFIVESTGALSPKKIITEAFSIMKTKFLDVDKILSEIDEEKEI